MRLYIDPGTGSMLFAILIGVLGALRYLLRGWFVKLRFIANGGKKIEEDMQKIPLVIFSDDKRYWPVFEPVCRELNGRGVDVVYMTASEDDPALKNSYEHIRAEFIGSGNKAFAKLNFLKASVVFTTTPGLDVYQWKRSKDVDCYIHVLHAPNEITGYRMFGTDYFDTLLLSGDFQESDVRELEQLRGLPAKEIYRVGIPYLDEMKARLDSAPSLEAHERTVLLAPSWGPSGILSMYGEKIIDRLISTGYHIIVRPHPQSMVSEREIMDRLMEKYPTGKDIEWNFDVDNFEVLRRSDIMISDFSGVIFDFSLVYDKPVIYTNSEYDNSPYDAWWLDHPSWTFTILPKIGKELNHESLDQLKGTIDLCLLDENYAQGREQARRETWEYRGSGAVRIAEFLEQKVRLLNSDRGRTEAER